MSISPHHSDVEWIHESHSRTEKREREGEIEKREERRGKEGGRGRRGEVEEGERERERVRKKMTGELRPRKFILKLHKGPCLTLSPHYTPQQFSLKDALECSKRMCGLTWSV